MKSLKTNWYLNVMATLIVVELFVLITRHQIDPVNYSKGAETSQPYVTSAAYNPPPVTEVRIVGIDYENVSFPIHPSKSNPRITTSDINSPRYLQVGVLGQPIRVGQ